MWWRMCVWQGDSWALIGGGRWRETLGEKCGSIVCAMPACSMQCIVAIVVFGSVLQMEVFWCVCARAWGGLGVSWCLHVNVEVACASSPVAFTAARAFPPLPSLREGLAAAAVAVAVAAVAAVAAVGAVGVAAAAAVVVVVVAAAAGAAGAAAGRAAAMPLPLPRPLPSLATARTSDDRRRHSLHRQAPSPSATSTTGAP